MLVTAGSVKGCEAVLRVMRDAGCDVQLATSPLPLDEGWLLAQTCDAAGLIFAMEPVSARLLENASRLRIIARPGVGHATVDLDAASQRGVAVTIAEGTDHESVADFTFALLLGAARGLLPSLRQRAAARLGARDRLRDLEQDAGVGGPGSHRQGYRQARSRLRHARARGQQGSDASERNETARPTLRIMLQSAEAAQREHHFICPDAGVPVYFVKVGAQAPFAGNLRQAITEVFAGLVATIEPPLLPHVTHPLPLARLPGQEHADRHLRHGGRLRSRGDRMLVQGARLGSSRGRRWRYSASPT